MSRKRASKASSSWTSGPCGSSLATRRSQASGPRSFSSRSKIVPPRITASRREGGKEGRALSRRRRVVAARERPTWRGEDWGPPSASHGPRRERAKGRGGQEGGRGGGVGGGTRRAGGGAGGARGGF